MFTCNDTYVDHRVYQTLLLLVWITYCLGGVVTKTLAWYSGGRGTVPSSSDFGRNLKAGALRELFLSFFKYLALNSGRNVHFSRSVSKIFQGNTYLGHECIFPSLLVLCIGARASFHTYVLMMCVLCVFLLLFPPNSPSFPYLVYLSCNYVKSKI